MGICSGCGGVGVHKTHPVSGRKLSKPLCRDCSDRAVRDSVTAGYKSQEYAKEEIRRKRNRIFNEE